MIAVTVSLLFVLIGGATAQLLCYDTGSSFRCNAFNPAANASGLPPASTPSITAGPDLHAMWESFHSLSQAHAAHLPASKPWELPSSCKQFLTHRPMLTINSTHRLPLFLQPLDECNSFGNMLGMFFETVALGMKAGYAVGRMGRPHASSCNTSAMGDMFDGLPVLVLPGSGPGHQDSCTGHGQQMHVYPWEYPESALWRHLPLMASINQGMVSQYITNTNHPLSSERDWLHIHFRCSSSIFHRKMGIMTFSSYRTILQQIASDATAGIQRVVIATDASLQGPGGAVCWRMLGELEALISSLPAYAHVPVDILKEAAASTYIKLHRSRYVLCGSSTFCLMAAMGSQRVYIPKTPLFGIPQSSVSGGMVLYPAQIVIFDKNSNASDSVLMAKIMDG